MDINTLPELVNSEKLTVNEAVNIIAEYIYKNPHRFGLAKFDEDFRSEFIVRFIQRADKLLLRYDCKNATFFTYLHAFTRGLTLSLIRDMKKEERTVKHAIKEEENTWEYKTKKYIPKLAKCTKKNTKTSAAEQPVKNYCMKKNEIEAKTAIVLALKSSYFLSDNQVSMVSDYCGIERENLEKTLSSLNKPLEKRAEHCAELRARRDNAYYFHRKYGHLLKDMAEKKDERLLHRYERQTENWKSKNEQLQKTGYRLCPTHKTVGNVLGICERQVSYYISRARKKIKEGDTIEENPNT